MSESQKAGASASQGNSWSDHFLSWAEQLKHKNTRIRDAKTDGGFRFVPLSEVLKPLKKMRVSVGNATSLEMNLLYACYQAVHSKNPDDYSAALSRRKWEITELALRSQQEYVENAHLEQMEMIPGSK